MAVLDYLALYGNSFQTRIISLLMTDKNFLAQVYDILSPDFFESDANKEMIRIIKEYFKKYMEAPGLQVFAVKVAEQPDSILQLSLKENIRSVMQYLDNPADLRYIKDEFINFCKNQSLKAAVLESVDLLKSGKYEEILSVVTKAINSGTSRDLGLDYTENLVGRYKEPDRTNIIPTEWSVINEILDGGLGGGDLGVIAAISGIGKSWILTSIGLHAIKLGKNVLHFTMELNERYTRNRYDSRLSGIVSENLKYHEELVVQKIEANIKGKLFIQFFPTKAASVITLKAAINRYQAFGFNPNMIIVDYADLLKSDNLHSQKQGSYYELGAIYEDLRGLAGEYGIPVWTASQAAKISIDDEIITGDKLAESFKKVMTADFILSVARRIEDKEANTARWHVVKNRYGRDAVTFPSKMDSSIGKIEIFSAESVDGKEIKKDMKNNNEITRARLATQYTHFENT